MIQTEKEITSYKKKRKKNILLLCCLFNKDLLKTTAYRKNAQPESLIKILWYCEPWHSQPGKANPLLIGESCFKIFSTNKVTKKYKPWAILMKRHLVYNITITGLSLNIYFANCLFAIRKHIFAFENTHDNYYYVLFMLKCELQVILAKLKLEKFVIVQTQLSDPSIIILI